MFRLINVFDLAAQLSFEVPRRASDWGGVIALNRKRLLGRLDEIEKAIRRQDRPALRELGVSPAALYVAGRSEDGKATLLRMLAADRRVIAFEEGERLTQETVTVASGGDEPAAVEQVRELLRQYLGRHGSCVAHDRACSRVAEEYLGRELTRAGLLAPEVRPLAWVGNVEKPSWWDDPVVASAAHQHAYRCAVSLGDGRWLYVKLTLQKPLAKTWPLRRVHLPAVGVLVRAIQTLGRAAPPPAARVEVPIASRACQGGEEVGPLVEEYLNDLERMLVNGPHSIGRWLTTTQQTRSAWLPAVCRACAAATEPAAWLGVLEQAHAGADESTPLAIVQGNDGSSLIAVAVHADRQELRTWAYGEGSWRWRGATSLPCEVKSLGRQGERVLLQIESALGPAALRWDGLAWKKEVPLMNSHAADWLFEKGWRRRSPEEFAAERLDWLVGRFAHQTKATPWHGADLIRLTRLVREPLSKALHELREVSSEALERPGFLQAFWPGLSRAPDRGPLEQHVVIVTKPADPPRVATAWTATVVGAWLRVLDQIRS